MVSFLKFSAKRLFFTAAKRTETLVEAIYTATGINDTLFTSIEWVTFVTNIQVQRIFAQC
ncbi:hypothetical protein VRK_02050 [Vibrio sp. MEBiC08052]|nr:hypothetical protein VRK_02050 [Vibrio sp. MEBiC08052]